MQLLNSDTTATLPGRPLGTDDAARRSRPETIDFILSCSICQDTLSTLYAQSDKDGLRQGTDDYDGAITKLWLTECAHVTCAKHMEGGGVPFHPKDQPPKAPCPLCVRNNQDHSAKILYAIRGTARGEYDDNIPPEYFEFPPQQLNNSGNEALRFHYVSLVRFASGLHETLEAAQRELKTWKDRESSIVACLATMEPLSRHVSTVVQTTIGLIASCRALQSARDQLHRLRGDVTLIDNALQLAANLRVNAALPGGCPSGTSTDEVSLPPASIKTPAGSLLARGSAMDLQYIQDGLAPQDGRDSSMTTRASRHHYKPSPKRRRLDTADSLIRQREHESNIQNVQQRLDSRDAMPPPSEYPPKNHLPEQRRQWFPCESQGLDPYLTRAFDNPKSRHGSTATLHTANPIRTGIPIGYNPCLAPNGNYPNTSRSVWERTDDGELDRALQPSISGTRSVGQPTPRLTLPPSTPAVKRMTPRRRVGISANARTSQPPFSTPESSSSLQRRIDDRNPGHNAQIVPSPHFSIKTLPTFHTAQRPYTNSVSFSYERKTSTATPKLDGHASKNFSWLPALRGEVERQDRQRSQAEELGSSSGAYRRPSEPWQSNYQPLSLNSFSFTNKPYIGPETVERRLNASSVHHGRRAVRR
ncbi:MAG: hypothetical protein Q9198_000043 [Flavoplaca austrocitrina]